MFAAQPKRLAANAIHLPFSSRWLHYPAYLLLAVGLCWMAGHHGWETGIPIWLAMIMVAGTLVVPAMALMPRAAIAVLAAMMISSVIAAGLTNN